MTQDGGLSIALISVHGLIRGDEPQLGRDADTGGQVQYVLDLARTLSGHPDVDRVELLTRQILSTNVEYHYGEHLEQIADKAWIVRLPCGPARYLHKESLWPYLPQFVDHALQHFCQQKQVPDVIHSHYADAGAVGLRLSKLLDRPLIHTSHSLGRVKQLRLLEKGLDSETIEKRYNIGRRIAAEEGVFEDTELIVASTQQEVDEQYAMYDARARKRLVVIPPGVNLDRFRPPRRGERYAVSGMIDRFLVEPKKPMILAVQRPDERKNLASLISTYGENKRLREIANLVILVGNRDDIGELPTAQRKIYTKMLQLIDRYDLYGCVAYPKQHGSEDVAELYRLAANRRGVFVNPALTEPFGLTLIEAAASGLPIVATNDGGPREIVEKCKNGVLVDPLDPESISAGLLDVLTNRDVWRRRSRAGIRGADAHFSWNGHVRRYLKEIGRLQRARRLGPATPPARMILADRMVICDIDNTLIGDREALDEFVRWLAEHRDRIAFGVATGRVLERAIDVLEQWDVPKPDVLITAVGSEIYYGRSEFVEDVGWRLRVEKDWDPLRLREVFEGTPGLSLQPKEDQRPYKLSYFVDPDRWPGIRTVRRRLKEHGLRASVVFSHQSFLDLLPQHATKGHAVRYLRVRWGMAPDHVLVAGDSGNDAEMLKMASRGVVVANFSKELKSLRDRDGIYFAEATYARGIVEGVEHFGFVA
jgi:sucrose-phosphate synthase